MSNTSYYAYIRVSTVKQGKYSVSLPEQKSAIQAFATREGFAISEWFEEKETAAKRGRPIFGRMLKGLRAGKAKGVIIHKIDRGARNLKDWADLAELMDMGIEVHTANENLDLTSRGGRLTADLQAVVAADYIRNLREETKKGIYGRLKQGLYPLAAPLGYLDTGRGNIKAIDPVRAPLVRKVFELYGTGEYSLNELKVEALSLGLVSKSGKPVGKNSLSLMLNNPFYIGLMHIKKTRETFKGKHQPLISPALHKRVKAILSGRAIKKVFVHDYLFKRLLNCAHCHRMLTGERQKGHVYYRCHSKNCITKGIREDIVNSSISKILSPIQFSTFEFEWLMNKAEELQREQSKGQEEVLTSVKLNLGQTKQRLNRLTDALIDGLISKEVFNRRNEALLTEQGQLQERISAVEEGNYSIVGNIQSVFELAYTAQQSYINGIAEEKRDLLKRVSSNRFVDRKNVAVELKSPFEFIANRIVCIQSCLQRDRVRTLEVLFDKLVEYFKKRERDIF